MFIYLYLYLLLLCMCTILVGVGDIIPFEREADPLSLGVINSVVRRVQHAYIIIDSGRWVMKTLNKRPAAGNECPCPFGH